MNSEKLQELIQTTADKLSNDIAAAIELVTDRVLADPLTDDYIRTCIKADVRNRINEHRSRVGIAIARHEGRFQNKQKVPLQASTAAMIYSAFAFPIGGMAIGDMTYSDLERAKTKEAAQSAGHARRYKLAAAVQELLPRDDSRTVSECVAEKSLKKIIESTVGE